MTRRPVRMLDTVGGRVSTRLMPETIKQRLVRVVYPDLDATVARMIDAGASWREIAAHVSAESGVEVSYESIRTWYGVAA